METEGLFCNGNGEGVIVGLGFAVGFKEGVTVGPELGTIAALHSVNAETE